MFRPLNCHEHLSNKRLTDFAVTLIIKRVAKKAGVAYSATVRALAACRVCDRSEEEQG
jgi:hypothetical protein